MDPDPVHDMLPEVANAEPARAGVAGAVRLSAANPGERGVIVDVRAERHAGDRGGDHGVDVGELQRRLLEFGFVEGARIEVLHEGAIWRDPIAVRVDDMRIGIRRRDAEDVWVLLDAPQSLKA
jgi:ferrous iron transport protein A